MKKFYKKVISHPVLMTVIFVLLTAFFALCKPLIPVNYDMNDYLPDDSRSTVSLDVMEQEFDGGIPNARVMLMDVTVPQALDYKEKISGVDGVDDVMWLDDSCDITQPIETMDADTVETYYKDGNALLTVTISEEKNQSAVNEIRDIIGDKNSLTGSAVSTAVATESTVSEISLITLIAVIFVIIVLLLTTNSWIEPVVIMAGLGVSLMINAGSNIIFGEISFVTNAAGMVLQLAVSLDYSVFLLHRFEESRKEFTDPKEAMADALTKSTGSILSSGLTTVIGFLALGLMRFKIGPDLGFALAKGVAISLICVFVFMPCLTMLTYKLLDKTRHRPLVPKFDKFGKAVSKIMIPMAIVFAIIIAPVYLASNANDFYYGSSHIFGTDTRLGADTAKIEAVFGKQDTYVVLVPNGSRQTEKALSDELQTLPQIKDIISYVDTVGAEIPEQYLDSETYSMLCSENYSRMVLSADAYYEGSETFALIENIRDICEKYYAGDYYLAGEGVSTYDLMDTVTKDMVKVNLIAIGAVFIVLLLTMRFLSLPVILVLAIETAIWLNLSLPYFKDSSVFYIAYLIISSVQLGATVDYAILMTDRYLEFRRSMPKKEAVPKTISTVSVSILTSGSVLTVVGLLLGNLSTHGLLAQLGMFVGVGAIFSLVIVFFVLPGLLYIFDGAIRRTTLKANFVPNK
ncbi:efflux RND transporter permease subunit [Huintestinicola sp.]|uniref:efflux RND transporter permease subunit n=1 Tax=Huintestinicola sp. TaxID=2981661 RepID=UPI003D7C85C3